MFPVLRHLGLQQTQHGNEHLFAQIGAIKVGKRVVVDREMAEKDHEFHENGADFGRGRN